ncbi:hypothetical protein WJX84_001240 [Apatococcus fuscideae]|uniref:Uncharacterized protein n=1 Tax=Apatococcus fuscideae TaxID=2026836 RepID=A0AAW1T5G4_9CHLO
MPSVALVGLPWDHQMVPAEVREKVRDQLALVGEQMEQAGYSYKFIPALPEDDVDKLSKAFASDKLDGVIVGMGIRGIPGNTYLFEKIALWKLQNAGSPPLDCHSMQVLCRMRLELFITPQR